MKKPRPIPVDSVQRAHVRRAQQTGKRQTAVATRRSVRSNVSNRRFVPSRQQENDVSVQAPRTVRRAFAFVIAIAVVASALFVIVKNLTSSHPLQFPFVASSSLTQETPTTVPITKRIGIVSGHRGNDSGSVCQDGLTEAQVNFDLSVQVANMLRAQGYTVDILDEFDTRLKGYHAALMLSIHADSCTYINDQATGFKVARVLDSKIPEAEDQLVGCMTTRYMASTNLRFHQNTVTFDMTKYHAFYEIDERTPAAIIETGFLAMDRQLLTQKSGVVAQGIYNGLLCFLNNETQKPS